MHPDERTDHRRGSILVLPDLLIFLFHRSISAAPPPRLRLEAPIGPPPVHGIKALDAFSTEAAASGRPLAVIERSRYAAAVMTESARA